ncbi:hypothetical protein GCM10010233_66410 [Streptomyces pseudogriseolus]|uniref:DUF853 family protein n=1 Tax=Nocardioides daeguensis TaxID=908359 RepID=A0ABP6VP93_9ACTN|nr:hypothetical protein GCM10010233_66410 [Streptomyces gancidicus]GGV92155.1 hypothetical protein GCM10010228_83490 [Streptomyces massasporeus]
MEDTVSTEQRDQQQPQAPAPAPQPQDPRKEFAKKGALAAIGGAFSGAAKAAVARLLGGDS